MTSCGCESSLCDHGDESCKREGTTPAPVQYLYGEAMCSACIAHYVAEGYGINEDGSPMPRTCTCGGQSICTVCVLAGFPS